MGRKAKYSKDEKMRIIKRYKSGERATDLASIYDISRRLIYTWTNKYSTVGEKAFNASKHNKVYSKDIKKAAIKDYLDGKGSLEVICNKYEISTHAVLRNWIIKYNSHIEIKDYDPKPEIYMAKSRKTNYEERIEIVNYCIEHDNNYKETAFKYGVNYAQVFSGVKKYKQVGKDGLLD